MAPTQDRRARALPLIGQPPTERADAARNRRAVLAAARSMMATCGSDELCMDRVAELAGVGVGTVYRRFGDRAGLVYALLDDDEREFQTAFLFGPPPLGPCAPPVARIRAFLHAYVDLLETHAKLLALAEAQRPAARFSTGAYRTHRMHLITLLHLAGHTQTAAYLADALLAALSPSLFVHQRHQLQFSTDRIKAGLDQLLAGVAGSAVCGPAQPAATAASTP
ncbi:MAG TPA: TetR/AcrR family transcriptional regulator [Pseudonocardiaceae bacterium]|nr:TetR/AcrR family transcriptional regulator [Pseudonocardiaceae bacterium]